MDLSLALNLVHALAAIVWLGGGAVLALILLVAGRDAGASFRAVEEAELIGRRVLSPAGTVALATGLVLAAGGGLALAPWVLLAGVLALGSLLARPLFLAAAFRRAMDGQVPEAVHGALNLALLDLLAQAAVLGLVVLRPGWSEAAILASLLTCLLLALALLRSLGDSSQSA